MDTPPPSKPSWQVLTQRARAESAPVDIDVRAAVRRQIEAEFRTCPLVDSPTGILDDVWVLVRSFRGISAFGTLTLAVLGFGWIISDALGEIAIAIQVQTQLLVGL